MILSSLLLLATEASASSPEGCYLADALDGVAQVVVIESLDGECSVELPDGEVVTIIEDEDAASCAVVNKDGGDNIIVIWPAAARGACDGGGDNIIVIWPS